MTARAMVIWIIKKRTDVSHVVLAMDGEHIEARRGATGSKCWKSAHIVLKF